MKLIITLLVVLVHSTLNISDSICQWLPDVRLTNAPGVSYTSINNAWSIAAEGNNVHVAWFDYRNTNSEVYYKRSTDGGVSWGNDVLLSSNNGNSSHYPSIAVSGQLIHVVYRDDRDISLKYEIYYRRSTDGGTNWGAETRLTNTIAVSQFPSLSVSGSNLHVVWEDDRNGPPFSYEIYYKHSTDAGVSWGTDTRLSNSSEQSEYPSVSVSGQLVHVAWEEGVSGDIFYKRSIDGGNTWGIETNLSDDPAISNFPCITALNDFVHVVWEDRRDGNQEIYYRRSTDAGINWETVNRLTNDPAISATPNLTLSGSNVHMVWEDRRDGNSEIYYKRSLDNGIFWGTDVRTTFDAGVSIRPSISLSGQNLDLVWSETRDANYEIYYQRNPTGNPVGIENTSSVIPNGFSLSQNYPNPFNPETNLEFGISELGFVSLKVYNALGMEVATVVNEVLSPGNYNYQFSTINYQLPSGVYFYKLSATGGSGNFVETKRMMLLK